MRDVAEQLVPLVIGGLMMLIPIVAILTSHQRKMAELMRNDQSGRIPIPTEDADRQLRELRELVLQQSIAIDNLTQSQKALTARLASKPEELTARINETSAS